MKKFLAIILLLCISICGFAKTRNYKSKIIEIEERDTRLRSLTDALQEYAYLNRIFNVQEYRLNVPESEFKDEFNYLLPDFEAGAAVAYVYNEDNTAYFIIKMETILTENFYTIFKISKN